MDERFVGLWSFAKFCLGVLLIVSFGFLTHYFLSPLTGVLVVHHIYPDDGLLVEKVAVQNGARTPFDTSTGHVQHIALSPLVDGEVRVASEEGKTKISFFRNDGERYVVHDSGVVEDFRFSPDGGSIAFASLSSGALPRQIPENYSIVRMLLSGESVEVGRGVRPFPIPGNATVALASEGVVSLVPGVQEPHVLIKTEVPATRDTPLAVSLDGTRIAWVNPMDNSLQIFSRTPAGTFVPLLLKEGISPSSLAFSPDGAHVAFVVNESQNVFALSVLSVMSGTVTPVTQFDDAIDVTQWIYE